MVLGTSMGFELGRPGLNLSCAIAGCGALGQLLNLCGSLVSQI